jgi:hypothetical protein
LLTACASQLTNIEEPTPTETNSSAVTESFTAVEPTLPQEFETLNDINLLRYIEDSVFEALVTRLDHEYFSVENVSAVFLSSEYLEQLAFNSQENVYFGYTLSELDEIFQGTRYIFTLGEDGRTGVQEFEKYDDTFDKIVRNLAIGTGVILLKATVSAVSRVVDEPAFITTIFSLKNEIETLLLDAVLSSVLAGIVAGVTTGDINQALTAAALTESEKFRWAAITASFDESIAVR